MVADGDTGSLPGASHRIPDQIVFHADVDCFYAACERLRHPELVGEPVVIGMGYEDGEEHGAVATASYEAREYGVESAQSINEALDKLPRCETVDCRAETPCATYLPVDMEYYESVSDDVMSILEEYADSLRRVSIDEAYIDVTHRASWEDAATLARELKNRIRNEVGVTASVGGAPTMSAAKIASDYQKPNGLVMIPPEQLQKFLTDLPVEDVHGVGPVTADTLRKMGIKTAGDVRTFDVTELEREFGERGREIWLRSHGYDEREVTPMEDAKSISNETSLPATADMEVKREKIQALVDQVTTRATEKEVLYRTIGIKVVEPPFDVSTRERSLPAAVNEPELVEDIVFDLLEEFTETKARKVGVRVSNLSFGGKQARLTDWDVQSEDDVGNPYRGTDEKTHHTGRDGDTSLSDFS
ncbi:DNA polymerase IV [Salinibaculum rarum]|uniref:DNA polymerase IV n=1 Tax=Salinibaculum rarum TaxID=3058903 RepID=UPI00265DE2F2|nr:DNA polymerase IV [Salinibaculum sp. KK48]